MEDKENKRVSIIVDDEAAIDTPGSTDSTSKVQKFKKPLIFALMGIVFMACLYLIFKPADAGGEIKDSELRNAVPEATDKGLQADKQKAYEKEMIDEKDALKRNSLQTLSDYWNNGGDSSVTAENSTLSSIAGNTAGSLSRSSYHDNSLNSYRNAQNTLSSFYQDDDREKMELRRKVSQLEDKLSTKDIPAAPTLKDQLTLMEKSYEMASKYLPSGVQTSTPETNLAIRDSADNRSDKKEKVESLNAVRKSIVSALYREQDDSSFLKNLTGDRYRSFFTTGTKGHEDIAGNSIRAMIMETKTISGDGTVKLRLQEDAVIAGFTIAKGTELEAGAKFQGNRLMLKISSLAVKGNIIPVEISGYDLNGQMGLSVPKSDEINAAGEIAANMSQNSGMNILMSGSAGQQIGGDLSRGLIQGVSGYFSKKLRATKVTLKAGHQVLLVTKK